MSTQPGLDGKRKQNSFYAMFDSSVTVRQVLKHIACHGAKCCFYCHKKFPGDRTFHVHGCWVKWKINNRKKAPPVKKWEEDEWRHEARRQGVPDSMWVKPSERSSYGFFPDSYLE